MKGKKTKTKTKRNLKRALSLLLVMLMLVSVVPLGTISVSASSLEGNGSSNNPYLIGSPEDLKEFASIVNDGDRDVYAKLTADIEINPGIESNYPRYEGTTYKSYKGDIVPEGNTDYIIKDFEGVFDGCGHTISGLFAPDKKVVAHGGLFSITRNATIKNVNVARSNVISYQTGGFINACYDTTISNVHILEDAYFPSDWNLDYIAHVVGEAKRSTIINCSNKADMWDLYEDSTVCNEFGGIVGYAQDCTIKDCVNYGNVDRKNTDRVYWSHYGGIVGNAVNCYIENCTNYGNILEENPAVYTSRDRETCAGGVVGLISGETNTIRACANYGNVYGESDCRNVGSIVGYFNINSYVHDDVHANILDCVSNGCVYRGDYQTNAFVGYIYNSGVAIINCFSRGCFIHNRYDDDGFTVILRDSYYSDEVTQEPLCYAEADKISNVTKCTLEQCKSGEIAYKLNENLSSKIDRIGQNIGVDDYPVINGKKVNCGYIDCQTTEKSYTNGTIAQEPGLAHVYDETGKCTLCGAGGSEKCPYPISTAEDLKKFADAVNKGATSLCAVLVNNINLNPGTQFSPYGWYSYSEGNPPTAWTPIGTEEYKYCGTFDGAGHTIRGLFTDAIDCGGLFGYCDATDDKKPVIKNLNINNSHIEGFKYAGAIVGNICNGTVSGCSSLDDVYIDSIDYVSSDYYGYSGGMAGYSEDCEFSDCSNSSRVISGEYAGGIVGKGISSDISRCCNTGYIKIESKGAGSSVGGIAGYYDYSQISDVYNTGNITISDSGTSSSAIHDLGGILGFGAHFTLTNAYNTGTLTGTATSYTGAAVGYISRLGDNAITNFYYSDASLDVSGKDNSATITNAEVVTAEQLASGEVTYKLNGQTSEGDLAWGQNLDLGEAIPVLSGETVYLNAECTGKNYYANYVIPLRHFYSDGKCEVCGAYEDGMGAIYGYSASLGGNIGMNFIMEIDDAYQNENTSMNFSVQCFDPDTSELKELYTKSAPFSDAEVVTVDDKTYYKFTCNVPAKEMSCAIKGRLVNGDKQGTEFSTSVADYAYKLYKAEGATYATQSIVESMLNFGAYAQEYFGFNTQYPANGCLADVDKKLPSCKASEYSIYQHTYTQINKSSDIGYYGNSLVLEANTEVKYYFTFDSSKTSLDDVTVEIKSYTYDTTGAETEVDYEANIEKGLWGDGKGFYVKITDIPPHYFDKKFILHIYEGGTEQCSMFFRPISYFYDVLEAYPEDDGVHDSLRNLVKAYYEYGVSAFGYNMHS